MSQVVGYASSVKKRDCAAKRPPEGSQTCNVWKESKSVSRVGDARRYEAEGLARLQRATRMVLLEPDVSRLATVSPPLRGERGLRP